MEAHSAHDGRPALAGWQGVTEAIGIAGRRDCSDCPQSAFLILVNISSFNVPRLAARRRAGMTKSDIYQYHCIHDSLIDILVITDKDSSSRSADCPRSTNYYI
jgi:hypothetical protein